MDEEDFETKLNLELPRGLSTTAGQDRGVFARWLEPGEMTGKRWEPDSGLLLGQRDGRLIGWNDDRHVMTIAGSRAGKGTSLIVPNLLRYEGSAFVLDPKGENAAITAGRRGEGTRSGGPGMGQDVHVLDPFGVSGRPCAHFNPLDELHILNDGVIEDAGMFADALITHPERGERHWTESAQALLRALILVAVADKKERRNLVTVRKLLMLTDDRIKEKLRAKNAPSTAEAALFEILMQQNGVHTEVCQGVGEQLRSMDGKERGSVLSTARTQTQWLDNERIRKVIRESNFEIADLKRKKTTIYLCLPAMHLATHARWFRLMIMLAISVMERTRVKVPAPVLYVLDEFPVLGHMQSLESAAGLMAGFDVKLWTILQNVGQLKQHYDRAWETFFANSGVVTAFGVSDQETLSALSAKIGRMRMIERISRGRLGTPCYPAVPPSGTITSMPPCSPSTKSLASSAGKRSACWCWARDAIPPWWSDCSILRT